MQNFSSLATTQTDLAKFFTFFPEFFKIFQKRISIKSKFDDAVLILN
jgi:hypothetical protein